MASASNDYGTSNTGGLKLFAVYFSSVIAIALFTFNKYAKQNEKNIDIKR